MVISKKYRVDTRGNNDVLDITGNVAQAIASSSIKQGIATVFVVGSTAAITTIEYEPGMVEDIKRMFERIAPMGATYQHNLRWGDDNGHSHLRASLLGPSLSVPVTDGGLLLGVWQQIVLIDFDVRPRTREFVVQLVGE